jgi:hypothetical protein
MGGDTVATVCAEVDGEVAKWRSWIEGPIYGDVVGMHHKRMIWREMNDAIRVLGLPPRQLREDSGHRCSASS